VKELGFYADVHGFRTSFRTWAQEKTNYPREVAEAALAHLSGDAVERAYHGILLLEVQAVIALREGRFMPHLHGIVWRRRGEGLEPLTAVKRLRQRFIGIGKAKGVVMRRVEQRLPKALATRFFYCAKLPDTMKRFCPSRTWIRHLSPTLPDGFALRPPQITPTSMHFGFL
jgi:hypothetical protein